MAPRRLFPRLVPGPGGLDRCQAIMADIFEGPPEFVDLDVIEDHVY